jgi:hypothetical protein
MFNTNIFAINFKGITELLLPPILRKSKEIAWLTSLTKPLQYDNDLFLDYINGSNYPIYNSGTTYVAGNRVINIDRGVYESINGSTGIVPTDTTKWTLINGNYIGAVERSRYNSQKYLNEYALNRWFQVSGTTTTSLYGPSYNNIYIKTNVTKSNMFVMGQTGPYSDYMLNRSSSEYMFNHYIVPSSTDFTIYVPTTVTTDLQSVRTFEDLVVIAGITYDVVNY